MIPNLYSVEQRNAAEPEESHVNKSFGLEQIQSQHVSGFGVPPVNYSTYSSENVPLSIQGS